MKKRSHSAQVPLAVALVMGIGLSLGGCAAEPTDNGGGAGSSQTEQGATIDGGEKAPAEDAGSKGFIDEDGEVPDWVAAGFPIYPGSVVAASGGAGDKTMISFSVPNADEQTIYEWFVEQYSQDGWEIRNPDDVHSDFDATNTDGREAYFNVTDATFVMSVSKG